MHMEVVQVDGDIVVEALIADTYERQQRDRTSVVGAMRGQS